MLPRLTLLLSVLSSSLLLSGCAPKLATIYTAPTSKVGLQCIQNCQQFADACRQIRFLAVRDCLGDGVSLRRSQLDRWHDDYIADDKRWVLTPYPGRPFADPTFECRAAAPRGQCQVDYNICYRACGGRFTTTPVIP